MQYRDNGASIFFSLTFPISNTAMPAVPARLQRIYGVYKKEKPIMQRCPQQALSRSCRSLQSFDTATRSYWCKCLCNMQHAQSHGCDTASHQHRCSHKGPCRARPQPSLSTQPYAAAAHQHLSQQVVLKPTCCQTKGCPQHTQHNQVDQTSSC
jgi:hypothetical protein